MAAYDVAPDSQSVTREIPLHQVTKADGNTSERRKHGNIIENWTATYTFDDYAKVQEIWTHFEANPTGTFTWYDWRNGSSTAITNCKYKKDGVQESVNRVGEYVVTVNIRRVTT